MPTFYAFKRFFMPHPIDKLVGSRIRQGRWVRGLTQQQLGEASGCKFQQIQKYETAANRVSASRLWGISRALDMPLSYFFDNEDHADAAASPALDRESAELLRAMSMLPRAKRQAVLDLAKSMAESEARTLSRNNPPR